MAKNNLTKKEETMQKVGTVKGQHIQILEEHQNIGNLKVIVFNVGQGDHCLLQFPNGSYGIIDFYFEAGKQGYLTEPPAITYLRNIPEDIPIDISFICITHTDYDHLKGITESIDYLLYRANSIDQVWLPQSEHLYDCLQNYQDDFDDFKTDFFPELNGEELELLWSTLNKLKAISDKPQIKEKLNKNVLGVNKFKHNFGPNITLTCLAPLLEQIKENAKKVNTHILKNYRARYSQGKQSQEEIEKAIKKKLKPNIDANTISTILQINYQYHQLLFPGDTTLPSWKEVLKTYKEYEETRNLPTINPNFIKAAHHGSKKSSSVDIWKQILPEEGTVHIAFSAGKGHSHPNRETIAHIEQAKSEKNLAINIKKKKTNKCVACLHKNDSFNHLEIDLFDYEKEAEEKRSEASKKRKKIFRKSIEQHGDPKIISKTAKSNNQLQQSIPKGLMGLLYTFDENNNRHVDFQLILSHYMKTYPECIFNGVVSSECPSITGVSVL